MEETDALRGAPQAESPPAAEDAVQAALTAARAQWEIESEQRVSEARREAEQLARMTADERLAHEFQTREAEVARREAALARRELRGKALDVLDQRALPRSLAEALNYQDEAACLQSLDQAERAFRAAVQQGVESRLKGTFPRSDGLPPREDEQTDQDFYRAHFQNRGGKTT